MSLKKSEAQLEIISLAEAVADEYCAKGKIDPCKILDAEKIGYGYGNYGDTFDGMLEFKDSKYYVYANLDRLSRPSSVRTRFTFGHELGHYYIDEHRIAIENGVGQHQSLCGMFDRSQCNEEREADLFAANLLMPPSRVIEFLGKHQKLTPLKQIQLMAAHFDSSITSSALQFIALSSAPTAAISWRPSGESAWVKLADEFRLDDTMKFWSKPKFQRAAEAPRDSASSIVLRGEEDCSSNATLASYIFANVKQGGHRDILLTEECMALGDYGALTIISKNSEVAI
ncbi:MAG: ImmA/IrrE family metallo-endopeptidase [Verrucomicrobiae bacterium]|nr:ImmA/IrrE family metallo-endopeptidase [Verrucomicrobiae bacterium]NNJ42690.1 ImmA/IrrE family metallo-endopeptidase [Akkermansiaceae bacterium]